jgi:hypothetical protein
MFNWFRRKRKTEYNVVVETADDAPRVTRKLKPKAQSETITRECYFEIRGVEYVPNGVTLVRALHVGEEVLFVREPDNPHDKKAVAVVNSAGQRMGYVPAYLAADLVRALDQDKGKMTAARVVRKIAEGREHKRFNALLHFHLERQRRRSGQSEAK